MNAPKVFVSHAGEDRQRFVDEFARRLRENGVDAWTSFWEMNPGDSLIDKVFENGLKNCDSMIVVLSKNSVGKKWVREELNAGMVRRIEDNTKLIPIRLDGCEVPACLRSRVWQDIPNLESYDNEFERVLNAIFGVYEKPPLGEAPTYVTPDVLTIGGLSKVDSVIFEAACRKRMEQPVDDFIRAEWLVPTMAEIDISENQIIETQEILAARGYIKLLRAMGPAHAYSFRITFWGLDQFVRVGIPGYDQICKAIAVHLVRKEHTNNRTMAEALGQPLPLVEHIFESLQVKRLIKYHQSIGGGLHLNVYWVSPELRRKLED